MFCSKSLGNAYKGAEHGAEGDAGTFRTPINRHRTRPLAVRSTRRRIRTMKVKELIETLEADGWFQVRMKGSHRQFHHASKPGTVTVAGKPSIDVPPGTLNSALKQAGLKK